MKMKYVMVNLFIALFIFVTPLHAAHIGSVFHDYGIGKYESAEGSNPLYDDYIKIYDGLFVNSFSDVFDFSGMSFKSIDRMNLTLKFSSTNDSFLFWKENWKVRPATSHTEATNTLFDMTNTNDIMELSFVFTGDNLDIFSQLIDQKAFYLWFAEESIGIHNFQLYSANLDLYGTPIPEPDALLLLGLGLFGIIAIRKKF